MANETITSKIEGLNKWIKALLFFITGGLFSAVFRIIRFTETKNIVTLVVAIVGLVTFLAPVLGIVDAVTELANEKVTVLAD